MLATGRPSRQQQKTVYAQVLTYDVIQPDLLSELESVHRNDSRSNPMDEALMLTLSSYRFIQKCLWLHSMGIVVINTIRRNVPSRRFEPPAQVLTYGLIQPDLLSELESVHRIGSRSNPMDDVLMLTLSSYSNPEMLIRRTHIDTRILSWQLRSHGPDWLA